MKKGEDLSFNMSTSLKRIFKSGWLSFSQNRGSALATIFIIAIPIFLITWLFLLNLTFQFLISELQKKVDISVYFKEDILEEEILKTQSELSKISEVKNVKYVSKEEALENFIKRHKDNPVLMESLKEVGDNPFLASLNIKAWQFNQYQAVANFLEKSPFRNLIEKVDYYQRKPVIERIFSLTSGINKAGLALSLVLSIVAILVVFNTIRLAIINQKEEISIQRLVGASNWFIQGPFLVQGVIAGILATLVTLLITGFGCYFLSPKMEMLFPGLNIFNYLSSNFGILLLIQLTTGIGLGVISSLIAIRKYLKV